jgi:hypothetical protein
MLQRIRRLGRNPGTGSGQAAKQITGLGQKPTG